MMDRRTNIRCSDMSGAVGYGRGMDHHHQHGKGNPFVDIVKANMEREHHKSLPGEGLRDKLASMNCGCKGTGIVSDITGWLNLFKILGKGIFKKASYEHIGKDIIERGQEHGEGLNLDYKIILSDILKHIKDNAGSPVEAIKMFADDIMQVLAPGGMNEEKMKQLTKKLIKYVVARKSGSGLHLSGAGKKMKGGSFDSWWRDFKKGFTMVFKPGAKILGTIATAIGQPEIGVPLTAVSNVL